MAKKKKQRNHKKHNSRQSEIDLSICMIVKDEEKHLPQCLKSLQPLGAELIIVDTGSSDRTVEIAESFGAKLFHFPWNNNFSDARNQSLAHATRRWILWIDADDILPETEHAKIRKLAKLPANRAFHFILKNDGIDSSQCYQLRMFPNHPKIRFEGAIHEQVAYSVKRLNLPTEEKDVAIVHTGYSSEEIVQAKKEKYLAMMASWLKEHPNDCLIQYQFALTNHTLNRHQEAVQEFEVFLSNQACLNKDQNAAFYALVLTARSYLNLGDNDRALHYLLEAKKLQPDSDFLKMALGETYTVRRESREAIHWLESVGDLSRPKISFMPLDYSVLQFGREILLATNFIRLGKLNRAKSHLMEAEKLRPERAEVANAWGEWYERKGDFQRAKWAYEKAVQMDSENFLYHFRKATVSLTGGEALEAKREYEVCQKLIPDKKEILVNLGVLERVFGRLEPSLSYFQRLKRLGQADQDVIFQEALTLFDAGQWEKSAAILKSIPDARNEKSALLLLLNLLRLENIHAFRENLSEFLKKFRLENYFANQGIPEAFKQLSGVYGKKGRFAEAELAFQIYLSSLPQPQLRDFEQLAEKQMRAFHLNAALNNLEYVLTHSSEAHVQIRCFQMLEKCYQSLGVPQAVAMCRQQIQVLTQKMEPLSV